MDRIFYRSRRILMGVLILFLIGVFAISGIYDLFFISNESIPIIKSTSANANNSETSAVYLKETDNSEIKSNDETETNDNVETVLYLDTEHTYNSQSINYKPDAMPEEYYNYAVEYANKNNISLVAILTILTIENKTYNPNAQHHNTNGTVDMGLCQVNSMYYQAESSKYGMVNFDPYDPKQSIEFLSHHFKYLCDYANNNYGLTGEEMYLFAAGAYNRGLGGEIKYRNMYQYKERFLNTYNQILNNEI